MERTQFRRDRVVVPAAVFSLYFQRAVNRPERFLASDAKALDEALFGQDFEAA